MFRVKLRNVIATAGFMFPASFSSTAQQVPPGAPVYSARDSNGVNLASALPEFEVTDLSIGAGDTRMFHTIYSVSAWVFPRRDSFDGFIGHLNLQDQTRPVEFNGQAELFFDMGDGTFVTANQRGSTLVDNGNGTWTYTLRDGTTATIDSIIPLGGLGHVTRVKYPDGRILSVNWRVETVATPTPHKVARVQSVTRSDGLQFKYNYQVSADHTQTGWGTLVSVKAINNAYEYCAPNADTCSLSMAWPTSSYAYTVPQSGEGEILTITDQAGGVTRFTFDSSRRVTGVKWPTSASADNVKYTYCNNDCFVIGQGYSTVFTNMVTQVVRDGQTWDYDFYPGGGFSFSTYSSTSPVGGVTSAQLASTFAPFTTFVSPLHTVTKDDRTSASFNPTNYTGRVNGISRGEAGPIGYEYDSRGNVTEVGEAGKVGSTDPSIVTSADYDDVCSNALKCNKANWVRDPRGNQTDFTYSSSHGGVLTATGPAVNGVRPQTRYVYSQRYAWIKNASGSYVKSSTPIWVLAQESFCRTSAAMGAGCAVANDEVITAYEYGPDSGPNNLFLRGVAVTAGGQTLRTCYSYDRFGNSISETLPRADIASCP